ncbi:hypothetical protein [Kitasatospora sp. NPDC097691]|uniref:hypothetical protein n=1 Tax=Kitasatospora sp. NPDC097691 TaxID=3157231 RepID=UPI00332A6652
MPDGAPKDAPARKPFCGPDCRKRAWRRRRRRDLLISRGTAVIFSDTVFGAGRCEQCNGIISVRKRLYSRFCSPACRTSAWRERLEATQEPSR